MAAKYKITWSEDGSSSIQTAEEIHASYGGDAKQAEFIAALLSTAVLRNALQIRSFEELSAETLFEEAQAALKIEQEKVKKAKAVSDEALFEIFMEITADQVDEGEVHKLSDAGTALYSITELWIRKGTPNLDALLARKAELPTHVGYDLERIKAKRLDAKANPKAKK